MFVLSGYRRDGGRSASPAYNPRHCGNLEGNRGMSRLDGALSTISMWHAGDYTTHTRGAKDVIDNARDLAPRGDCGDGRRRPRRAVPDRRLRRGGRRHLHRSPPRDDLGAAGAGAVPSGVRHLYRSPAQRLLRPVHHRERRPSRGHELSRRARRRLRLRRGDEFLRADLSPGDDRLRIFRDCDALAERTPVPGERSHPHGRRVWGRA